jgi:hypothetical protein
MSSPKMYGNHRKLLEKLIESGEIMGISNGINSMDVHHDNNCAIYDRKACNCNVVLVYEGKTYRYSDYFESEP